MKLLLAPIIATVLATAAIAQEPEQCRVITNDATAVSVTHGGKTYRLANDACRAQFLSDPDRYAQLYDALAELDAAGRPAKAKTASLVPS